MSKKVKTNKKLYVALPLKKLTEGEIAYISSEHLVLTYDDNVEPEVHRLMISKRASYIKFPDRSFDLKIVLLNGEFVIDEGTFYSNNAILQPVPSIFYDMKYYYPAQKINYAYFVRKRGKRRLTFISCIDELLMLSDEAYKQGKLDQEDQERFDYLLGWAETKFPIWAEKIAPANIIKEIDHFEDDLNEINRPYAEEHIEQKDYHYCDLAMVIFIDEIVDVLEKKMIILIKASPKLIMEVKEEDLQTKIITILQQEQAWETLAAIRDIGIKIPE